MIHYYLVKKIDWGVRLKKVFKPLCIANKTDMAVNNRNQLMPCCYIDTPHYLEDPTLKKLVESSDISKHKSLEDIINSKEWVELNRIIHEANGDTYFDCIKKNVPWPCVDACSQTQRSEERHG